MEVKMNKEIRNYQESMFMGLNLSQCIFSLLAIAVAVGIYFGLGDYVGQEMTGWLCILGAAPFAVCGFFQTKINPYCHSDGKQGKDTLAQIQSHKHGLLIVADFFIHFYFHILLSLFLFSFSLLAIAVAVGIYFGLGDYVGQEMTGWLCILGAAPFAACGFFQYHGMNAEQFAWAYIKSEFLYPKRLLFQSEDLYHACMEETMSLGEKTRGDGTVLLKKREQRARKKQMKQKKKSGRSGAFD